jgi:hypothetical protein
MMVFLAAPGSAVVGTTMGAMTVGLLVLTALVIVTAAARRGA